MLEQIEQRYGRLPAIHLADAGFRQHADIECAASNGTLTLIPASHVRDGLQAYAPPNGPIFISTSSSTSFSRRVVGWRVTYTENIRFFK